MSNDINTIAQEYEEDQYFIPYVLTRHESISFKAKMMWIYLKSHTAFYLNHTICNDQFLRETGHKDIRTIYPLFQELMNWGLAKITSTEIKKGVWKREFKLFDPRKVLQGLETAKNPPMTFKEELIQTLGKNPTPPWKKSKGEEAKPLEKIQPPLGKNPTIEEKEKRRSTKRKEEKKSESTIPLSSPPSHEGTNPKTKVTQKEKLESAKIKRIREVYLPEAVSILVSEGYEESKAHEYLTQIVEDKLSRGGSIFLDRKWKGYDKPENRDWEKALATFMEDSNNKTQRNQEPSQAWANVEPETSYASGKETIEIQIQAVTNLLKNLQDPAKCKVSPEIAVHLISQNQDKLTALRQELAQWEVKS